ncbi:MAG: hypothetical protein FJY74_02510 [Candidatus Eisenbacteria bacterium]|nr:hypothetical protein [Candidatus Eisenbacteria bacterium]
MSSRFREVDLRKLRVVSIEERGGTVTVDRFATPHAVEAAVDGFLESVPDLFAGREFRQVAAAVVNAARARRPVVVMFGAHFVKCGLSRLLIDLMERGVVTALATNGAGAIHDAEIAMWGKTSEDVRDGLTSGLFGACRETAELLNGAVARGSREGRGFGESVGSRLADAGTPHRDASIAARAHELGIPLTVHVALGTDIVHEHASADGAAIGETSLRDFRILADVVCGLDGGVVLNVGSAVVLPEVFLKALAVARNLGRARGPFTTVSLDMNEPYRAGENVVRRPTAELGMGIALRGHHEILFPALWCAIVRGLGGGARDGR